MFLSYCKSYCLFYLLLCFLLKKTKQHHICFFYLLKYKNNRNTCRNFSHKKSNAT